MVRTKRRETPNNMKERARTQTHAHRGAPQARGQTSGVRIRFAALVPPDARHLVHAPTVAHDPHLHALARGRRLLALHSGGGGCRLCVSLAPSALFFSFARQDGWVPGLTLTTTAGVNSFSAITYFFMESFFPLLPLRGWLGIGDWRSCQSQKLF